MNLQETYVKIAERAVDAGGVLEQASLHESASFFAYHAFESVGAAVAAHFGVDVRLKSHAGKLKVFAHVCKSLPIARQVAVVALIVNAVRNSCLYPHEDASGTYQPPDEIIKPAAAKDMVKRVAGVVKAAKSYL